MCFYFLDLVLSRNVTDSDLGGCSIYPEKPVSSYRAGNVTPFSVIVFAFTSDGSAHANGDMSISTLKKNKTASLSTADRRRFPGSTCVFTMKIKWDVYTISAEGEKQVCDNMNKIWELLMICILMTHHHANQFVLWPQIADWCRAMRVCGNALGELRKNFKKKQKTLRGLHRNYPAVKIIIWRYGCRKVWTSGEGKSRVRV